MLFALADCNSFYASCETAFKPFLRGRPVIVLSNNDTVHFRADASKNDAAIDIIDEKGTVKSTTEHIFQGALGAR